MFAAISVLIAISNIAPTTAIAMIIATTPLTIYVSVGGRTLTGYGDAVGVASSTVKAVSACDGQYDSDPLKVAITVYLPGISGVHGKRIEAACVSDGVADVSVIAVAVYDINGNEYTYSIGRFGFLHVDILHPSTHTFI